MRRDISSELERFHKIILIYLVDSFYFIFLIIRNVLLIILSKKVRSPLLFLLFTKNYEKRKKELLVCSKGGRNIKTLQAQFRDQCNQFGNLNYDYNKRNHHCVSHKKNMNLLYHCAV
jgi:hypothetical protein